MAVKGETGFLANSGDELAKVADGANVAVKINGVVILVIKKFMWVEL